MSGKGGRKRDFFYESFYHCVDDTSKNKRFKCLYCYKVTSQNWSRMLDHLSKKCFNAPEDISKACGDELRHKINEAADISASVTSTPSKLSIPSSTPFIKRHFTPRLPKDDLQIQRLLHTILAVSTLRWWIPSFYLLPTTTTMAALPYYPPQSLSLKRPAPPCSLNVQLTYSSIEKGAATT